MNCVTAGVIGISNLILVISILLYSEYKSRRSLKRIDKCDYCSGFQDGTSFGRIYSDNIEAELIHISYPDGLKTTKWHTEKYGQIESTDPKVFTAATSAPCYLKLLVKEDLSNSTREVKILEVIK